jgi:hypothetical protein
MVIINMSIKLNITLLIVLALTIAIHADNIAATSSASLGEFTDPPPF